MILLCFTEIEEYFKGQIVSKGIKTGRINLENTEAHWIMHNVLG